jgi:hypothetical protein
VRVPKRSGLGDEFFVEVAADSSEIFDNLATHLNTAT